MTAINLIWSLRSIHAGQAVRKYFGTYADKPHPFAATAFIVSARSAFAYLYAHQPRSAIGNLRGFLRRGAGPKGDGAPGTPLVTPTGGI